MKTVSEAIEIVSYVTDTPQSRVSQLARALINAGLLPKSSGRSIEKISAEQLFFIIAAVAAADTVAEAGDVVREISNLPLAGGEQGDVNPQSFFAGRMKGEQNPTGFDFYLEISKTKRGPVVKFEIVTHSQEHQKAELTFAREKSWGQFCKRAFIVSPEGMEVLNNMFSREGE